MNIMLETFEKLDKLTEDTNTSDNDLNWVKRIQRCLEKGVLDPMTLEEFISEYEEDLPKKYVIIASDGRYWANANWVRDDYDDHPSSFLFNSEKDAERALRRMEYDWDDDYWNESFDDMQFKIVEIIE